MARSAGTFASSLADRSLVKTLPLKKQLNYLLNRKRCVSQSTECSAGRQTTSVRFDSASKSKSLISLTAVRHIITQIFWFFNKYIASSTYAINQLAESELPSFNWGSAVSRQQVDRRVLNKSLLIPRLLLLLPWNEWHEITHRHCQERRHYNRD